MKTKEFKIPDGLDLGENEEKGMQALADHLTKQFAEFAKGALTDSQLSEKVDKMLEEWGKKNNFEPGKISEILKKQGLTLNELKERNSGPKLTGLKAVFMENFDTLKDAIKNQKQITIKADPDVIDEELIENTGVITTDTGAFLPENNKVDPALYTKRRDRQYIEDIADVSVVAEVPETLTYWEEGDEKGNIAIVEENGLKPQVQLKLIKNKAEKQKAAGFIVVTEELMKFRTRAWAMIQRLFRDKVMRDFRDLLTVSLSSNTASYITTPLDGTISNPTNFDALIAAILQLELLNFEPDVLVINPTDKWRLAMTTTPNGMFILPYIQQGGQFSLLYLKVITSNKIPAGTALVGESGIWKVEREEPTLRTGLVNDDHIHNRKTIVGEIYFLSYVPSNNAGGFVEFNFDDVKEALSDGTVETVA